MSNKSLERAKGKLERVLARRRFDGFVQYRKDDQDGFTKAQTVYGGWGSAHGFANLNRKLDFIDSASHFNASIEECEQFQTIEDLFSEMEVLRDDVYWTENILISEKIVKDSNRGFTFQWDTGYLVGKDNYRKGFSVTPETGVYRAEDGERIVNLLNESDRDTQHGRFFGLLALPLLFVPYSVAYTTETTLNPLSVTFFATISPAFLSCYVGGRKMFGAYEKFMKKMEPIVPVYKNTEAMKKIYEIYGDG